MEFVELGALIEEIETLWIPMPDGSRRAARAWLPDGARAAPVPAILEYIPYRKRDLMRHRDEPIHRYFALNGYASLRVDRRTFPAHHHWCGGHGLRAVRDLRQPSGDQVRDVHVDGPQRR